ncbi:allophanate hydrolase [Herbidospora sp. NEAU-GS84]|uniref:Allophanate hydrolase n=1 Tax=Herbidospora solisilvae TaxID=2696284 RepID=A0A7C9NJT8_9ACTN|nr:allophanate hydrolase [Herbidospora solisilvae]NAS24978.1 allophanate hydrolase [Herbidospora solisilvae]
MDLQIPALRAAYRKGLHPREVVAEVYRRIKARGDDGVWITLRPEEEVLAGLPDDPGLPLYGVPFAVKDNIDVAGLPTTVACPDFAYAPGRSAPLVDRLIGAGAILIGKNNLDQFATGLSGSRSPYGSVESPLVKGLISGGSSSGSAVAVSAGLVSFSIGTDTAGSGRVPAVMTGTVGLKPSKGLVSTLGVVPACASLDCPSVFALNVPDARVVLEIIQGYEPDDPWSRELPRRDEPIRRIGVIRGDDDWTGILARLAGLGYELVDVDIEPFLAAGRLLYEGPWVAERWSVLGPFVESHPESLHPVTAKVLGTGAGVTGADAFRGLHRLRELMSETRRTWAQVDALAVPTVPRTFTLAEMAEDPIGRNSVLGTYTTFANLLDLAGIAVPAGFTSAGGPHGVTLLAPAGADGPLADAAERFHTGMAGATPYRIRRRGTPLAVVGAHRTGHPLHPELVALGATSAGVARTAAAYRLYDLGDRPGMVRTPDGASIEVELFHLGTAELGELLTKIAPPLGLGSVELDDGSLVTGFLCEAHAAAGAADITGYGSWPAYVNARP